MPSTNERDFHRMTLDFGSISCRPCELRIYGRGKDAYVWIGESGGMKRCFASTTKIRTLVNRIKNAVGEEIFK